MTCCCCCCCCWAMGKCCSTHVVPGLWFGWSLSSHQKLFQTPLECLFISPSVCYDPQTLSPVQFTFLWASPESHSSEPVRVRPVWISFHFICSQRWLSPFQAFVQQFIFCVSVPQWWHETEKLFYKPGEHHPSAKCSGSSFTPLLCLLHLQKLHFP